ncbi:MAG: Ribosomal RNA small subunit methyltransferase A [Alphaproteobacteria bacterium MarineAlpha5_Bin5]|nr:MAG: Ribosomal RNA small subunit methyltransferase A [Alphaproteobacteria bacterium MarineAlpha5_Bin5]
MIIPKKSLGQNFLKDKNIINKINNIINFNNKTIVEIGPGLGFLTEKIIKKNPKKFIIIEKDEKLYDLLNDKFKDYKNITIINDDIFNYNFNKLNNALIVSNLPYNISRKLIIKLIKLNKNIDEMIFMIQKELSEKFNYNNGRMNKYKFLIKLFSEYQIYFDVSKNVFYPKPKVKSSVVGFKLKKVKINKNKLELFIKTIFTNNRKKIKNKINIKNNNLIKLKDKRIDELNIDDLFKVYKFF